MSRILLILLVALGIGAANGDTQPWAHSDASPGLNGGDPAGAPPQGGRVRTGPPPTYFGEVLPIFMGKCSRCHNDQLSVPYNWFDYQTAYRDRVEIRRRVWQSWRGTYYKQPMPAGNGPESQTITERERAIIKDWVDSGALSGAWPSSAQAKTKGQSIEHGQRLFATICSSCHQPNGLGLPGRFPPLAGSDFLNADKSRAIRVLLRGLQGEVTVNGQRFNNSMPRFPLSDEDIAGALTYVYNSFGNSGKEVTPQDVNAVRQEKEAPTVALRKPSVAASEEKSPFE